VLKETDSDRLLRDALADGLSLLDADWLLPLDEDSLLKSELL
jgi:hypothetical protein